MNTRILRVLGCLFLGFGFAVAGCTDSNGNGSSWFQSTPRSTDPVLRVICLYIEPVFLSYDVANDRECEGFGVTMYLESAKTGKGIVVPDGTLTCTIHRADPDPRNSRNRIRTLVFQQSWPMSAFPHSKKPAIGGYGYRVDVVWGEDLNLTGKEVDISFAFKDSKGRLARSQIKRARVPVAY